jgi:hypothetical protein
MTNKESIGMIYLPNIFLKCSLRHSNKQEAQYEFNSYQNHLEGCILSCSGMDQTCPP